jgi:hypothetical protein
MILVGLSRRPTTEQRNSDDANRLEMEKTFTQGDMTKDNDKPFAADELSKAMTAVTIKADG